MRAKHVHGATGIAQPRALSAGEGNGLWIDESTVAAAQPYADSFDTSQPPAVSSQAGLAVYTGYRPLIPHVEFRDSDVTTDYEQVRSVEVSYGFPAPLFDDAAGEWLGLSAVIVRFRSFEIDEDAEPAIYNLTVHAGAFRLYSRLLDDAAPLENEDAGIASTGSMKSVRIPIPAEPDYTNTTVSPHPWIGGTPLLVTLEIWSKRKAQTLIASVGVEVVPTPGPFFLDPSVLAALTEAGEGDMSEREGGNR